MSGHAFTVRPTDKAHEAERQELNLLRWVSERLKQFADGFELRLVPLGELRSARQNNLMWAIMRAAHAAGFEDCATVDDVHDLLVFRRYGVRMLEVGGELIPKLAKTSRFKKSQMADFLDWAMAHLAEHGITIPPPPGYEDWKND